MGYELVDTADIGAFDDREAQCLEVSDHFVKPPDRAEGNATPRPDEGPQKIGLRVYFAETGQSLGGTDVMHYHEEQEETFYIVSGTLVVETPEREYRVDAGQALVVDPGSPQRAFVPDDAEGPCHVVAIGAPSYSIIGRNDAIRYDD